MQRASYGGGMEKSKEEKYRMEIDVENIGFNDKELTILMYSLQNYLMIEQFTEQRSEQGCCRSDDPEPPLPYYLDTVYIRRLYRKVRRSLMYVPLPNHNPNGQYGYGEKFGYQKMTWDECGRPDRIFRFLESCE
jgi:hypothetical protein